MRTNQDVKEIMHLNATNDTNKNTFLHATHQRNANDYDCDDDDDDSAVRVFCKWNRIVSDVVASKRRSMLLRNLYIILYEIR